MEKRIVVRDQPIKGMAGVVQAGPFLFVAGCDGHRDFKTDRIVPELAADAEAQCENSYGMLRTLLGKAKSDMSSVVRIDHVTSSMDWLPRRQAIRSRIFGLPAPMASTGIAGKMSGINMLTSFVIAVTDPKNKKVLVPGPRYAMDKISAAVHAGPLVFISGVRSTLNPMTKSAVAEETPESFSAQTSVCYQQIKAILGEIGLDAGSLLRIDCYLRDGNRAAEGAKICREVLGAVQCASTTVALPFSGRGEIEVTTLAVAPGVKKQVIVANEPGLPTVVGAEGFLFVGECLGNGCQGASDVDPALLGNREDQLDRALDVLEKALKRGGSTLARTVRLELWLRDIYFADTAAAMLCKRFGDNPPAVSILGAELEDLLEVKLNAIAV